MCSQSMLVIRACMCAFCKQLGSPNLMSVSHPCMAPPPPHGRRTHLHELQAMAPPGVASIHNFWAICWVQRSLQGHMNASRYGWGQGTC